MKVHVDSCIRVAGKKGEKPKILGPGFIDVPAAVGKELIERGIATDMSELDKAKQLGTQPQINKPASGPTNVGTDGITDLAGDGEGDDDGDEGGDGQGEGEGDGDGTGKTAK